VTFHFYSVISTSRCGLSGLKNGQLVRLLLYKQTRKISGSKIPNPTQVKTQGELHVHFVTSIWQSILDQGFRGIIQVLVNLRNVLGSTIYNVFTGKECVIVRKMRRFSLQNRVLIEKSTVAQQVNKFSALYVAGNFITLFKTACQ